MEVWEELVTMSQTQDYKFLEVKYHHRDFAGGAVVKNPPANAGNTGSIPGLGRFPHATEKLSPCTTTTEPAL